ncbi:methyl-accepting chemotaxis protein [Thiospirillum jenense]|uniref:Cache domain-containing protein n=1 Tax=Thiospirillum jenense TaxID=1653858 RepID=A0A839HGX2_9GAMM|nr:methyl-accepting chemotaxis protein [Thiospirillum jenense]MBB1126338.1 cache domain-containing protein [Thiospirillum jenense]
MNRHSISFRISFWSGLTLVILGGAITAYAVQRMNSMADRQRVHEMNLAHEIIVNAAKELAVNVKASIEVPLDAARTLAQAFGSAARKEYAELTDADYTRLQTRFRNVEVVTELARSAIQPYIAAAANGQMTLADAQKNAVNLIRQMRFDGGNYLWIQDTVKPIPRMIMHPIQPQLDGERMDNPEYNTAMGLSHNFATVLNEICLKDGNGYVRYNWSKPGETAMTPKFSFGRLIPEWGWVLGSGMWLDSMSFYSRADLNSILRVVLENNSHFLATYTAWEQNAFDGLDSQFVNKEGTDASGRFIPYWSRNANGSIKLEPLVDYDKPGAGDYYLLPKQHQVEQVINPYFYPVQGQQLLITSLVAPVIVNNRFRGIAGVDLVLDGFQASVEKAAQRLYNGQAEVMLVANNSTLVASNNPQYSIGKSIDEIHRSSADSAKIRAAVTDGVELTFEADNKVVAVVPIQLGYTKTPWAVEITVPMDLLNTQAEQAISEIHLTATIMIIGSIVAVIFGVALMLWVAIAIARQILKVAATLRSIADGEGDLTRQLDTGSGDELAELAKSFNGFQKRIRDLVAQIAGSSERVAAAAEELSATSIETNGQVRRQQSETEQVATAMNEMTTTVSEVAHHAQNAAHAAMQADDEATAGRDVVARTVRSIQVLSHQIETSKETIDRLSNDSSEIGKILDVIRDIADQTNLLALNAAIEAARAGEQGRGFAVVADEVRTLASRTQASTREIQQMIERLQSGAATAVMAMDEARSQAQESVKMAENTGHSLDTIANSITTIRDMNNQIASATEEQSAVAAEVDRNLTNSTQAINAVAASSSQINNAAIELAQLAAEQQNRVSRFKV